MAIPHRTPDKGEVDGSSPSGPTEIELAEDRGLMIEGPRSGRLDLTTATGRNRPDGW
jgi:hypothetical protein